MPKSDPQIQAAVAFWRQHFQALRNKKVVSESSLVLLAALIEPQNIGYDEEQISPDIYGGRWDIYCSLRIHDLPDRELLLLSGLAAGEVAQAERCWQIRAAGFNPDDPEEAKEYDRIQRMSKAEVARELKHLERRFSSPQ